MLQRAFHLVTHDFFNVEVIDYSTQTSETLTWPTY